MFARVLVPLDGSRLAESALPAAEALRMEFGSVITLIHLLEKDAPRAIHGERHLRDEREADEYLAEVAGRCFPAGARVERHVHSAVVAADVPLGLTEHSKELSQDLIVMCVHGKGGFERMLEGNLAERVVSRQAVPVLLVRSSETGSPMVPFRRILVALDAKGLQEQSLSLAAELALKSRAEVLLVTVVPTWTTLRGAGRAAGMLLPAATAEYLEFSKESTEGYLKERAEEMAEGGVDAETLLRRGNPVKQIVRVARERGSELIVLGTHGRAGTKAFWAGSVAAQIVDRTDVPVLLVPYPRGLAPKGGAEESRPGSD